jgi:hypothetical protein
MTFTRTTLALAMTTLVASTVLAQKITSESAPKALFHFHGPWYQLTPPVQRNRRPIPRCRQYHRSIAQLPHIETIRRATTHQEVLNDAESDRGKRLDNME